MSDVSRVDISIITSVIITSVDQVRPVRMRDRGWSLVVPWSWSSTLDISVQPRPETEKVCHHHSNIVNT